MRVVFMGTPEFAIPSLKMLIREGEEIVCVVTRPDITPVKRLALENGLCILQPESAKNPSFIQEIRNLNPDIVIVVAYGQILSEEFLSVPKFGCVNVHASLLPKFRGSAPIQWAILEGESKTGVTVQSISERLDCGDIIVQKETGITPLDDFSSLSKRLADMGADALRESISLIKNKCAKLMPQDERLATYARKIVKEDGLIDWNEGALKIHNKVRALNPWPGTWTFSSGLMIKIIKTEFILGVGEGKCGEILSVDKERIVVHCTDGIIYIEKLQPEAKRKMTAGEFVSGYRLKTGMQFDKE